MGAELTDYSPKPPPIEADPARKAAVRIADQFGTENPHPQDDEDPAQAGRDLAQDPLIAAGIRELVAQLGIRPDQIRRTP